jgi:hypothetical protein
MKVYWLSPPPGTPWLSPQEVVERWAVAFPRVTADAEAARARGERFIGKYRELLAAGRDHNPTPLEEVVRRWSGALLVEVWADAEGAARFRTVVGTDHRLELEFGRDVAPRSRRGLAGAAARALGYRIESVDGD